MSDSRQRTTDADEPAPEGNTEDDEVTVDEVLDFAKEHDCDPFALVDHREYKFALAEWYCNDDHRDAEKYAKVMREVNWRGTQGISKSDWETDILPGYYDEKQDDKSQVDQSPEDVPEPEEEVTWSDVDHAIQQRFDARSARAAIACATVKVRMLMEETQDCPVLILKGPPSTNKTTVTGFFENTDRSSLHDTISPRAFVSHNRDGEEGEYDLLPRIAGRTILAQELNPWFKGEEVDEFMAKLSRILDGRGFVKSTGAMGTTGYQGDYRFGIIGATTPLSPRAWTAIGNSGSRFIFFPMPKVENTQERVKAIRSDTYTEDQQAIRDKVTQWFRTFYHQQDGSLTKEDCPAISEETDQKIGLLADLLASGRAVDYGQDNEATQDVDTAEQIDRIFMMFRRMAQSRALLYGKDTVDERDLEMLLRATLESMPTWRQQVARLVLDPDAADSWKAADVEDALNISRKTARKRMREAGRVGLAKVSEEETQGGTTIAMRRSHKDIYEYIRRGELPWPY
jgi:hypothetical protein